MLEVQQMCGNFCIILSVSLGSCLGMLHNVDGSAIGKVQELAKPVNPVCFHLRFLLSEATRRYRSQSAVNC